MANRTVYVKDLEKFVETIVKAGFSYRQLANKTKSNPTTITLIAKGERNPSPELAVNICCALDCQFDDIFFIQNDYKSKQIK